MALTKAKLIELIENGDIDVGGGVPPGGTTGQVVTKNSNADFDAGWANQATVFDLLWENPSPSTPFVGQTVLLDLSVYGWVYLVFLVYQSSTITGGGAAFIVRVGEAFNAAASTTYNRLRAGSVDVSGVNFNSATQYTTYGATGATTNNSALVPYRIFGVKNINDLT